eukprot:TRINITY_DN6508_c0_g1_i15.p2 TRINITY_DN6508_c0_g1~~TRINITY_DN6508_c0_g1_i15.p2  ORF type:complete len:305 (-),score=51.18 TRINITY_DN6508_c0_g1_i15:1059-1973(-)
MKQLGNFEKNSTNSRELLQIKYTNGVYKIKGGRQSQIFLILKKPNLVQPYCFSSGYSLAKRTVVRFSRVQFLVRDVLLPAKKEPDAISVKEQPVSTKLKSVCKACGKEGNDAKNPLTSPCKCTGTLKYVHLECLKREFKDKVVKSAEDSYVINEFECKKCKEKLHLQPSQVLDLLDVKKADDDACLILESLLDESAKKLHVLVLNENSIATIGRASDCSIAIGDVSVSRHHATLKLQNGQIYLSDSNSKFGTLIKIKDSLELTPNRVHSVQAEGTVISLLVKNPKLTYEDRLDESIKYEHKEFE